MGLVLASLLAAVAFVALWRFGRLRGSSLQLAGAAIFFALAGYAWQGRPSLEGQPAAARNEGRRAADSEFAKTREAFLGRFDSGSRWLIIADSYQRRGNSADAVGILNNAVRRSPRDSDLWTGLGYALVLHADGVMTPAAELAFARASQIAPMAPGPRFYYGLALARGGRFAEAERQWGPLFATAPAGAEWRPLLGERLAILRQLRLVTERQRRHPAAQ